MNRADKTIHRPAAVYSRAGVFTRLVRLITKPARPLVHRRALRKQTELAAASEHYARLGLAREATEFAGMADQWGRIAAGVSQR